MIQRWQSLALLLTALMAFIGAFVCHHVNTWMEVVFIVLGLASFADIFLFKNRVLQARICLGLIVVAILFLVAVFIYYLKHDTGPGSVIMAGGIIAGLLKAYGGIMSDEKLVRSLDRIR